MSILSRPATTPNHGISVQSLGSGSSGNAFIVMTDEGCLLIDCGVGIRSLTKDLQDRNILVSDIDTICVTHEHSDHIRTLPKVIRHDTTIFATDGTAIRSAVNRDMHVRAIGDTPQKVGDITVWPLPVLHDAQEPCGFMLELPDSSRVTMLTDLGSWHESLVEYVRASNLIILEANHDEEMLRTGPYPQYLKKRVASDVGHLSNRHSGIALGQALRTTTHQPEIWLAHLSEHNNLPFVAEETVRTALRDNDLDLSISALPRRSASRIWTPAANAVPAPAFVGRAAAPLQQLGFDLLM
jgi:phosphoribosyl 1,2-cyclic phosphodiesterase